MNTDPAAHRGHFVTVTITGEGIYTTHSLYCHTCDLYLDTHNATIIRCKNFDSTKVA